MIDAVLITGAGGYIGRLLVEALAKDRRGIERIVAVDVKECLQNERLEGIEYVTADVRAPEMAMLIRQVRPTSVVHLAAIMLPGGKSDRAFEYSVDVGGTENVLNACVEAGVKQLVITSSGAAYGYHADNPEWLDEQDALRGNPQFSYSDHKRLIEEMLARYRVEHPGLTQLILRPGTILGATANNQITALFSKRKVVGLRGVDSPFVIIWDMDVVGVIIKGVVEGAGGIYNLAGDGTLTMARMAGMAQKTYAALPVGLVKAGLWFLGKLRLTPYGPEQTMFLEYRPVLSNRRLKEEFGYTPQKTTREVFEFYLASKGMLKGD